MPDFHSYLDSTIELCIRDPLVLLLNFLAFAAPLFGHNCTTLPGVLNLAYGPCQQAADTLVFPNVTYGSPADATKPLRPILEWLNLLGLQQITEVTSSTDRIQAKLH